MGQYRREGWGTECWRPTTSCKNPLLMEEAIYALPRAVTSGFGNNVLNAFHTNRIRETFGDVLDGNESACHKVFGASVIKQRELERLVPES